MKDIDKLLQEISNKISSDSKKQRSEKQMTLGDLIDILKKIDEDYYIMFDNQKSPATPHSYRGYYTDLAFEETDCPVKVGLFLKICENVLNKSFEGYKGGDFFMDKNTPLWVSQYGDFSQRAIVDYEVDEDEWLVLKTKILND